MGALGGATIYACRETKAVLYRLNEGHNVVLRPYKPKVLVMCFFGGTFAFLLAGRGGKLVDQLPWYALGAAPLLKWDLCVNAHLDAHLEQRYIYIRAGELHKRGLYVHFPVPMREA